MTPPAVSIPRERVTTSRRSRSWIFSEVSPERMNGGLDNGTVGDSIIGSDGLAGLLAVEEVGNKLDDTENTGGTTDEDDFVNVGLVDLGVTEDLLDGLESGAEEVLAELLETGTSERGVEIDTLEERVDLDGGLGGRRECTLGTLASRAETTESTGVGGEICG